MSVVAALLLLAVALVLEVAGGGGGGRGRGGGAGEVWGLSKRNNPGMVFCSLFNVLF